MKTTIEKNWNGKDVKVKAKSIVGKSAYEIGLVVEGQAKLLVHKDTGLLASTITTQSSTKGTEPESASKYGTPGKNVSKYYEKKKIDKPTSDLQVFVGTPIVYGPYQEFGTRYQMAHPFLRPALDLAKGRALTIVQINGLFYFREYLSEKKTGGTK